MKQSNLFATVAAGAVLGAITFLSLSSPAEAAIICSLKKGNTTIQISTGHNNPDDTYKQINGGGWSQVSGTAAANCAKYRGKGYK